MSLFFWRKRFEKRYLEPNDYLQLRNKCFKRVAFAFVAHALMFMYLELLPENMVGNVFVAYLVTLKHVWIMVFTLDVKAMDAIWVTWATFTTVGYGDISATTPFGRLTTIAIGTYGIFQLPGILTYHSEYHSYQRELKQTYRWEWKDMTDHILIVGLPVQGTAHYVESLLEQIKGHPDLMKHEIQFLAENVPAELQSIAKKLDMNATGYRGSGSDERDLEKANVRSAAMVLVLCPDPTRKDADDVISSIVYRIRQNFAYRGLVIAEASADRDLAYMKTNGATSAVLADHYHPGILVSEALSPGVYALNRDNFQAGGIDTNDYPITIKDASWADVACKAVHAGWDFRGYVNGNGDTVSRILAEGDRVKDCVKVFIAAPYDAQPSARKVRQVLTDGLE
ncbi:MAG: potassium channel family protein [Pseudomonadota bacterium]|nr:potassium channel family protein [Pseudomonadota bacterium]